MPNIPIFGYTPNLWIKKSFPYKHIKNLLFTRGLVRSHSLTNVCPGVYLIIFECSLGESWAVLGILGKTGDKWRRNCNYDVTIGFHVTKNILIQFSEKEMSIGFYSVYVNIRSRLHIIHQIWPHASINSCYISMYA